MGPLYSISKLAPAGAGGVPTRPDLNLLPSSLVDRVEILTGGASAIYGADAVAGVVNIITRKDFDGFEINGFLSQPIEDGGDESQVSFIAGANSDRGNVTFAGEFYQRTRIAVRDRDYAGCERFIADIYDGSSADDPGNFVRRMSPCFSGFPDASAFTDSGLEFYTPGFIDPLSDAPMDWSTRVAPGWPGQIGGPVTGNAAIDQNRWVLDNEGSLTGHEFGRFNDQDEKLTADLFSPLRRFTLYSEGNYDADLFGHESTLNFGAFYSNRQVRSHATPEQALPFLPGEIPMLNADGTDFLRNADGSSQMFDNPLNPFVGAAEGILILDKDFPQIRDTEVEQIRITGGATGDIGLLPDGWTYDLFTSYDRTIGYLSQDILFEPNVFLGTEAVFLDQNGDVTCGLHPGFGTGEPFTTWFDAISPAVNPSGLCTPLDWFNPSVLNDGEFATEAERDFITSTRTNRTVVQQSVFSGYVSGPLFEGPAGPISGAIGAEYRIDKIDSTNDVTVTRGLQASETVQSEGNASGETFQYDVFAELDVPILANRPLVEELSFNAAVRYTEEKNFGNELTYSARGNYAPTDWLNFRGTYATAFRAPNLREQFLAQNASGTVPTSTDPCYIPANAIETNPTTGERTYNAADDQRSAELLAKCAQSGADPTQLGLAGFSISAPTFTTGETSLNPETADTYEIGFVLRNPYDDIVSADLAVTLWNIQVEDTVEELNAGDVIFGCFFNFETTFQNDPLCQRIGRSQTGDPTEDYINRVETSFVNIGKIETQGVDIDLRLSKEITLFDQPVTLSLNSTTVWLDELTRQFDAEDPSTAVDFAGTILSPEWESRATFGADWSDFRLRWRVKYTSGEDTSNADDDLNLFFTSSYCGYFGGGYTDTNPNPATGNRTSVCRSVDYADDHFEHDVSVGYDADTWSATVGVTNVFDETPPLIDAGVPGMRNNVVTSAGYDVFGRSVFVSLTKSF